MEHLKDFLDKRDQGSCLLLLNEEGRYKTDLAEPKTVPKLLASPIEIRMKISVMILILSIPIWSCPYSNCYTPSPPSPPIPILKLTLAPPFSIAHHLPFKPQPNQIKPYQTNPSRSLKSQILSALSSPLPSIQAGTSFITMTITISRFHMWK